MKTTFKGLSLLLVAGTLMLTACGNEESSTTTSTTTDTAVGATSTPPPAETASSATTATPSTENNDGKWVSDVVAMNMAEINAHTAAQSHATTSDVKMHAKHMLTDHKKMGDEMTAYASKKNITLPTAPPEDKVKMLDELNTKKGKDWDMGYLEAQVNDHKETIAKFESGEQTVTDPELKAMITKTLPTLRDHLKMVEDAQAKVK